MECERLLLHRIGQRAAGVFYALLYEENILDLYQSGGRILGRDDIYSVFRGYISEERNYVGDGNSSKIKRDGD